MSETKGWSKCQMVCITQKISVIRWTYFLMLLLNTNVSSDTVCVCAPWTKHWCLLIFCLTDLVENFDEASKNEANWFFIPPLAVLLFVTVNGDSLRAFPHVEMWKVQCIIAGDLNRSGDLLEQHDTPIQMSVGCAEHSCNRGVELVFRDNSTFWQIIIFP